jgi:putative ABC transport system permease protein
MAILSLAFKSLRNRKVTIGLTIASIALSVTLLLGVERIRREGSNATNNIEWESYETLSAHPGIAWSIPISLGDTHAGYRVLGTTGAYFDHFRYGRRQALQMPAGRWFGSEEGAVLGAEVAEKLGYRVGADIVVAHGSGDVSFIKHDAHPFHVVGILARTGTPVDRTVFVSLAGIDAIHAGMEHGSGR